MARAGSRKIENEAVAETAPAAEPAAVPATEQKVPETVSYMRDDTWGSVPHWSCTKCAFDTFNKTAADEHRH